MQERNTYRQPVWLQILGSLTALFLIYEVVSPFVGLIYYAVDPTTRLLRQTQNTVAAGQVSLRYEATTFLIFGLEGIVLAALVGLVVIGFKWLNRQINVLRPNLHGLPAVKEPEGWRVLTPPAPQLTLPATYEEGTLPPNAQTALLPSLPVYRQPLNPRYLLYGTKGDGTQIRAPLVDAGTTGIFGLTGTGKTEEMASIIITCVRLWHEQQVPLELVVFDPKGADFYRRIPKLACLPYPVVSEPKDCLELAETLVAENLKRQAELTKMGAVSLAHAWQLGNPLPVRVILIDEVTETLLHMNRSQNAKYLTALQSMVQVFRSGGGRVFLSTQRPAAKETPRAVVGQLEGGRIVYRCDTDVESKIALGNPGAENLPLTKGALLYRQGAETTQGTGLYADLKYRFTPYLDNLKQAATPAVTPLPLELQSNSTAVTGVSAPDPGTPVTQPLEGAVEAQDITVPISADDDEAEEASETDAVGDRVEAPTVPDAFIPLVPQDRMPENGREYSIIYATVNECGGQLKPAMRKLYRDRYGEEPKGGPYFYWTRYGYAMALKARDRVVDLRGDPVKEDWLIVPERYKRLGRR